MRLKKAQAIKECKELWKRIKETGWSKRVVIFRYYPHMLDYRSYCPLCEWAHQYKGCIMCPLVKQFGETCTALGYDSIYSTKEWFNTIKELK